jgi:hypothetical protein
VKHDVVLAVHPVTDPMPYGGGKVGPGGFLCGEDEDGRKHGGYREAVAHPSRPVAGSDRVGGDDVRRQPAAERAVPSGRHDQLLHDPALPRHKRCTFRSWHGNDILTNGEDCFCEEG